MLVCHFICGTFASCLRQAGAQQGRAAKAPDIKGNCGKGTDPVTECALYLTKGKFDLATAILKPLQTPAVTKSLHRLCGRPKDFRTDYRDAVQGHHIGTRRLRARTASRFPTGKTTRPYTPVPRAWR